MYNPDRPLTDRAADEFGLADSADTVAAKILELQPRNGLVVGLQSPWGMGKSTFLNFLVEGLERDRRVLVVRFAPWLVDDRDTLLQELFGELSRRLEKLERRRTDRWDLGENWKRRQVAKRIRRFAELAHQLKKLPKAPQVGWFKTVLDLPVVRETAAVGTFLLASVAFLAPAKPTLRSLRDEISRRLSLLNHKIVVVVDDIDRLEPAEAREVFRLVRAVADFPNTTYLVAFDREPLQLGGVALADVSRSYLDKIVQVPITLPEPEPVDLRRLLVRMLIGGDGAVGVVGRDLRTHGAGREAGSEQARLAAALEPMVRVYVNSPRRIGILHNILMTRWPSISEDADICDMLIYLCLTNFDPPLAKWVDAYLTVSGSRRHSRLNVEVIAGLTKDLFAILNGSLRHRADRLALLKSLLPSLRAS